MFSLGRCRTPGVKTQWSAFGLILAFLLSVLAAEAQPTGRVYRIGVLLPDNAPPGLLETFQEGLHELGYVKGRNLLMESRNAKGKSERLGPLADELVLLKVDVILAVNTSAARAAKNATSTIPIVMTRVADPVKSGLVASFSRPGGNLTGLSVMGDDVALKWLQLLKDIIPNMSRVAALWHVDNPGSTLIMKALEPATSQLGLQFQRLPVRGPSEFLGAFQAATRGRADAVVVVDDLFVTTHRVQVLSLAAKHSLPVLSLYKEFVEAGGLVAYGASLSAIYRRSAYYVARILKGASPGDLPIEQPTKFDLFINLKTSRTLGLTIPPALLVQAERVIE